MKKGITLIAVLVGVLSITSGAFAAHHYMITSSSQIKNGVIRVADLRPAARKALHGKKGSEGIAGPQGVAGAQGPKGDRGPQGPQGQQGAPARAMLRLAGDFAGTNASVATSLDGVQFGPYSDGGPWGGSVRYDGANGLTLSQLTQLSYKSMYSAGRQGPDRRGVPARLPRRRTRRRLFDPTQCATQVPAVNVFNTFEMVGSHVRYDDDSCDGAGINYSDSPAGSRAGRRCLRTTAPRSSRRIYVTTGFSGGADLTAILRSISVNGDSFVFGQQ